MSSVCGSFVVGSRDRSGHRPDCQRHPTHRLLDHTWPPPMAHPSRGDRLFPSCDRCRRTCLSACHAGVRLKQLWRIGCPKQSRSWSWGFRTRSACKRQRRSGFVGCVRTGPCLSVRSLRLSGSLRHRDRRQRCRRWRRRPRPGRIGRHSPDRRARRMGRPRGPTMNHLRNHRIPVLGDGASPPGHTRAVASGGVESILDPSDLAYQNNAIAIGGGAPYEVIAWSSQHALGCPVCRPRSWRSHQARWCDQLVLPCRFPSKVIAIRGHIGLLTRLDRPRNSRSTGIELKTIKASERRISRAVARRVVRVSPRPRGCGR